MTAFVVICVFIIPKTCLIMKILGKIFPGSPDKGQFKAHLFGANKMRLVFYQSSNLKYGLQRKGDSGVDVTGAPICNRSWRGYYALKFVFDRF